ncbi:MAG TPA: response regulator [Terriglobales bacterium]
MLDHDDLKWIAATATELNRRLHQVSRFSDQARQQKGKDQYLQLLGEEVDQALKTSQALFDRVTARILSGAGSGAKPRHQTPRLTVMPSPAVSTKMPVGEVALATGETGDPPIRNPRGQQELILIVDDDAEVLERVGEMLELEDYKVIVAKDGFEALRIYQRMGKKIALVILDFFLPVMDGDVVFDELKAINPNVHVVLSSGFAEQTKLGSMLARGLRGFLPKPYTHQKLIDQVRSIIAA